MGKVTLINGFDVPAGREQEFFEHWLKVNDYMRAKPGYVSHQLHRSVAPDAPYRFVNVAQWESVELFRAAHDQGFQALVSQPQWAEFPASPGLYEVFHEAEGPAGAHG
jgi:heme oxygenase (mycobilin-producing)